MDMSNISETPSLTEKLKVLDSLLCNNCEYYLNIPPLMSFRDSTTICGRCYVPSKYDNVPSNEKPTRNIPLESVIQFFPFACIYRNQGCQMRNVSKNYLNHEKNCRYRPFVCPVDICTWTGLMDDFKHHFEIEHASHFSTTSTITINTSVDYSNEYYLIFNENREILYQCKYAASSNKYFCDCVYLNCQMSGNYTMQLEFNADDNKMIFFTKQLSNTLEPIDQGKAIQFDVGSLKSLLNTDCLKANIKIYSDGSENNKPTDPKLLNELKCPVCLLLFCSPVFLCSNGHSICNNCKNRLDTCPICRVPYETVSLHNITLEQLIKEMIYPCKYNTAGCTFTALSTQIGQHEEICEYNIVPV